MTKSAKQFAKKIRRRRIAAVRRVRANARFSARLVVSKTDNKILL